MYYIYFVAVIILIGETESFMEDTTSIKISDEQRTLLRKLQNLQEPKDEASPLTWNEILADVLVNNIKIFSFDKVVDNDISKDNSETSKPKKILTNCFSKVLLIYKNCIYDKWLRKYDEREFIHSSGEPDPDVIVPVATNTSRRDVSGPKDEIELIEPKYHGKLQETDSNDNDENADCPEGAVRDVEGNCVKEISRLLVSVPRQCPIGYRADRLGNCRMVFF